MGRRGGTRARVTARGLGLALLASMLAAGCDATGSSTDGSGRPGGTPHPSAPALSATSSARPDSDAELCATIVAHWSRAVLDSGTYGDYQSMGLSNGQYEILRNVVDAARVVKRRQGAMAADELIDREARAACADRYRDGTPSGGPWR
ncbi:hypothetical protein [Streptomyces olivochromogenes]|uniref:hypothetical protein n=1 Tax=Streptomyces olivochromogenes TaxID=1963 RepID=UPI001F3FC46F|nr:hypothetical protein [Streptomyces olivochromogenes]MCF3133731.1 hypothetical protein [Streptomyces olivochromogenes]